MYLRLGLWQEHGSQWQERELSLVVECELSGRIFDLALIHIFVRVTVQFARYLPETLTLNANQNISNNRPMGCGRSVCFQLETVAKKRCPEWLDTGHEA